MTSFFQDSNLNIYATEYPLFDDADAIPAEELPDYSSLLQDFFYETGWCLDDSWYLCRSVVGWVLYPATNGIACVLMKVDSGIYVDKYVWESLPDDQRKELLNIVKRTISSLSDNIAGFYGSTDEEDCYVYEYNEDVKLDKVKVPDKAVVFALDESVYVQTPYQFRYLEEAKSNIEMSILSCSEELNLEDDGSSIHYGKGNNSYFIKVDFLSDEALSSFLKTWEEDLFPMLWIRTKKEGSVISLIGEFEVTEEN